VTTGSLPSVGTESWLVQAGGPRVATLQRARPSHVARGRDRISGVGDPASRRATYEDVLATPRHIIAEVIDGALETQSRPATLHAQAATTLGEELGPPFKRGRGGPGGWVLLFEPELHLGADILVPDLAGWRRERMPVLPDAAFLELAPDWVCEVVSPSTQARDRARKMPAYRREGVPYVWLLDPLARTLEVYRLDGETYRLLGAHADEARVRAEPFEAFELSLGLLWQR
jgi:Uma2 family endonuclease